MSSSPAREHEVLRARSLRLPKGSIVVEDMGYADYDRYAQLTAQKIFFVTRQKRNALYEVLERRQVKKKPGLLSDQTIRLTGEEGPVPLRRIAYRDAAPAAGAMSFSPTISSWRPRLSPISTKNAGRSRFSFASSSRI